MLAGKVAIVTGGAKGIGRGIVERFAEEGANVLFADLDDATSNELVQSQSGKVHYRRTDVSSRADVDALVGEAVSKFGRLDVIVNNAGIPDPWYGSLFDDTFEHFDRIMKVNLLGVMLGTQIAGRQMAKQGGGSIINIASIGGTRAGHGLFTYRASKAAVVNFTQAAAIDLGPHLIRVNTICPGNIPTEMGAFNRGGPGIDQEALDRVRGAVNAVRMTRQPLKRQGTTRDIADAALFLASDGSAQVTGITMPVDGGATAGDAMSLIAEISAAREGALAD